MNVYHLEKIWRQFTKQEQAILHCLSYFHCYFYYDFENFTEFLVTTESYHKIGTDPYQHLYPLLAKCLELGVFQKKETSLAFLKVHPLFQLFLKKKFQNHKITAKIKQNFQVYYENLATDLWQQLKTNEVSSFEITLEVIETEYANFIAAAWDAIDLKKSPAFSLAIIRKQLDYQKDIDTWLSFNYHLKRKISHIPDIHFSIHFTILEYIGNAHLDLHQKKQATAIFLAALAICKTQAPSKEIDYFKSTAYTNLGNCAATRMQQIEWQLKALAIAQQSNRKKQIGTIAYNLSEAYFELKDFTISKQYLERALQSFKQSNDVAAQIKAYQSLATHWQIDKHYDKAIHTLQTALVLTKNRRNKFQEAIILQEISSLYFDQKQLQKAKSYCLQALPVFIEKDNSRYQANAYNMLSAIAFEENYTVDGISYANQALRLFDVAEDKVQMAQTYSNIAIQCYREKWYEECVKAIEKARHLLLANELIFEYQKTNLLLASTYGAMELYHKAKKVILEALTYFTDKKNSEETKNCLKICNYIYKFTLDQHFAEQVKSITKTN